MSFRSMISCPSTVRVIVMERSAIQRNSRSRPPYIACSFFIELAFGFERALCGIRIEVSPDISFFGVVGDNGNEEVANVKHTFNDFEAIRIIKFGVGILSYDAPESSVAENIVTGNHKSNDGVVESAVEVGEIGTGDNVFISENFFVVKPNDTPEVFRFFNGDDGSVFVALNSVVPSHITHLVFRRKISGGRDESSAFEKCFRVGVVKHYRGCGNFFAGFGAVGLRFLRNCVIITHVNIPFYSFPSFHTVESFFGKEILTQAKKWGKDEEPPVRLGGFSFILVCCCVCYWKKRKSYQKPRRRRRISRME